MNENIGQGDPFLAFRVFGWTDILVRSVFGSFSHLSDVANPDRIGEAHFVDVVL